MKWFKISKLLEVMALIAGVILFFIGYYKTSAGCMAWAYVFCNIRVWFS